jgi:hypothetical protein
MRTHLGQEPPSVIRASAQSQVRPGSLSEVIAISLAWPLALVWFGQGLLTEQSPDATTAALAFFFLVFFYGLVHLYQLRRHAR